MAAGEWRRLAAGVAAGVLLTGCTGQSASSPAEGRAHHPADRATDPPRGRPGCRGVTREEVRGPAIPYAGDRPLAATPVSGVTCAAYWLPGAGRGLVPQGLALDGRTAWVGGYRFDHRLGARRCVLVHVSLRTGRRLAGTDTVGVRPTCHHGGGLALTAEGLWLAGTSRLWLLDPGRVGSGEDPVRRSWRLVDPLRGSTLAADGRRLGLGRFDKRGRPSDIAWFDLARVLAPGVTGLVRGSAPDPAHGPVNGARVGPAATSPGLLWLQGAATGPTGGRWLAQSVTRCGVLRLPGGRRVGFLPGAEGLALDPRGDLWALSESGSRPYQRAGGRPLVPQLVRLDAEAVRRGPRPGCRL